jgi:hypothetical protein
VFTSLPFSSTSWSRMPIRPARTTS